MFGNMDYVELGPTPYEEECAQVGAEDYHKRASKEGLAFIRQLIRQHGEPPEGATLKIRANPHDFGTYHEVAVIYEVNNEAAVEYAYRLEGDTPARWDDEARKELGLEVAQ